MRTLLLLGIAGAVVVVAGLFAYQQHFFALGDPSNRNDDGESIRSVEFAGVCVNVDVAESPEERVQGLSGRPELADGTGMLFVFDEPGIKSFWMKEMHFSIDILWFSVDRRVVHIEKNASPESFPESFRPDEPALYVLEVPSGFSEEYGVEEGDRLDFQADTCG